VPGESIKGDPGERGEAGPAGKLQGMKAWARGVHYEGNVVTHRGSTWCAERDTAEEPPHADWLLVAARGKDAPVGEVRGAYDPEAEYRKFDLVAWNGGEWRAKGDDPGPLPGDGWALSAQKGARGRTGERGEPGLQGPAGAPGPAITDWLIDSREFRAIPVLSDGSAGSPLDLRALFEAYHVESA